MSATEYGKNADGPRRMQIALDFHVGIYYAIKNPAAMQCTLRLGKSITTLQVPTHKTTTVRNYVT